MLNMFLKSDQDKAKKEMDCYGYCYKKIRQHLAEGDFGKVAAYHENMSRSMKALQQMKNNKTELDKSINLFKDVADEDKLLELMERLLTNGR